jgi:hypothetical protein
MDIVALASCAKIARMTYELTVRRFAATLFALSSAACNSNHATSPVSGYVSGSVSTTVGHLLPGVTVRLTLATGSALPVVKTDSTGFYAVFHVPAGSGAITISGAPAGCTGTSPTSYNVQGDVPATLNIRVLCP